MLFKFKIVTTEGTSIVVSNSMLAAVAWYNDRFPNEVIICVSNLSLTKI